MLSISSKTTDSRPIVVAISGGIGSGKSVVCRIVKALGYEVYDCDREARMLMDSGSEIKERLRAEIHPKALAETGDINRKIISEVVFADAAKLNRLNEIVHGAVRNDLTRHINSTDADIIFVETAIMYQSGLDRMADYVWEVTAPRTLRVERVMARNGLTPHEVMARIESQEVYTPSEPHPRVTTIINDGVAPLLPYVEKLLENINRNT